MSQHSFFCPVSACVFCWLNPSSTCNTDLELEWHHCWIWFATCIHGFLQIPAANVPMISYRFVKCSTSSYFCWLGTHGLRSHPSTRAKRTDSQQKEKQSTLWLFNIAMENNPFIDGLPIKHGWIFHGYVSHNQRVPPNCSPQIQGQLQRLSLMIKPWFLISFPSNLLAHNQEPEKKSNPTLLLVFSCLIGEMSHPWPG